MVSAKATYSSACAKVQEFMLIKGSEWSIISGGNFTYMGTVKQ
jgi:hypothetical protein